MWKLLKVEKAMAKKKKNPTKKQTKKKERKKRRNATVDNFKHFAYLKRAY